MPPKTGVFLRNFMAMWAEQIPDDNDHVDDDYDDDDDGDDDDDNDDDLPSLCYCGYFRKSGYDRGHLAAAANHRSSQNSMCATFFLSNMSPQVGEILGTFRFQYEYKIEYEYGFSDQVEFVCF